MSAYVYVIRDTGRVLYIGSTANIASRLSSHRSAKPWWDELTDIEVVAAEDMVKARAMEYQLIAELEPVYNERTLDNPANGWPARRERKRAAHASGTDCGDPICGPCRRARLAVHNARVRAARQRVAS